MNDQITKALGERDKRQSSEVELDQKTHTHREQNKTLMKLMNASKFRIFVCRKVDRSQCQFVEDDHFWWGRAEIPRVSRFRGRFWPNLQNSTTLDEI